MALSIQYQLVRETCRHCGAEYDVVRGPVLDEEAGVGLYLAGLHRCRSGGSAVLTVSILDGDSPLTFTLHAWPRDKDIAMVFIDGAGSPWAGEAYLGRLLTADEARESELKPQALEAADLICGTIPEVVRFLDELSNEPEREAGTGD
jgi:hypothetical protein